MCDKRSSVSRIIRGKAVRLDSCIADKILEMNERLFLTVGSCCGHGRYPETIVLKNRNGEASEYNAWVEIPRSRRFYVSDAEGFYYIPEISKPKSPERPD